MSFYNWILSPIISYVGFAYHTCTAATKNSYILPLSKHWFWFQWAHLFFFLVGVLFCIAVFFVVRNFESFTVWKKAEEFKMGTIFCHSWATTISEDQKMYDCLLKQYFVSIIILQPSVFSLLHISVFALFLIACKEMEFPCLPHQ